MENLILSAVLFCANVSSDSQIRDCVYDVTNCIRKMETTISYKTETGLGSYEKYWLKTYENSFKMMHWSQCFVFTPSYKGK